MATNITPLHDRVILKRIEDNVNQTAGGLFIPDSAKEKPQEAKVIALGTGTKAKDGAIIAFEVKVGDTVLIGKFAGSEVKLDDQKYTLIREDEILGVIA